MKTREASVQEDILFSQVSYKDMKLSGKKYLSYVTLWLVGLLQQGNKHFPVAANNNG